MARMARKQQKRITRSQPGVKPNQAEIDRAELTDREKEVLFFVSLGYGNRDVAGALGMSEATARTHVSAIMRKIRVRNRTQAALWALRLGLAPLYPEG